MMDDKTKAENFRHSSRYAEMPVEVSDAKRMKSGNIVVMTNNRYANYHLDRFFAQGSRSFVSRIVTVNGEDRCWLVNTNGSSRLVTRDDIETMEADILAPVL